MEKKHCEKLGAKVSRNSHPPFHSISPNFLLFIPFQRLTRWRLLHVRNLIRPKIGIWKCSFQFPPPPGSSFSTNSGVDFHHSEFHRRLLKYQWYYITLRDSQCIGRQSIPIFHPEPKVNTMKIYESLSKDFAYMKSKLESIRKRKRRKDRIIFRYRTNISTSDLYEMQATIRRLRK